MKKLLMLMLLFAVTVGASAQFEKGTKYVDTYLSGLGTSYNSSTGFRFNIGADAGIFLEDSWMVKANFEIDHTKYSDDFDLGLGARYYFNTNGIFLGAGAEYKHSEPNFNDVLIPVEIGYAFFINHYITIQPAAYYKMSLNNFSDGSTVGLKVALGFYFK